MPASKALTQRLVNLKTRWVEIQSRALYRTLRRLLSELQAEMQRHVAPLQELKKSINPQQGEMFDENAWVERFSTTAANVYAGVYESNMTDTDSGFGIVMEDDKKRALIGRIIRRQQHDFKTIARGVTGKLTRRISDYVKQGLDPVDIVKKLQPEFARIARQQLRSIAHGMIAGAYEQSRDDFWTEAAPNIEQEVEWLASRGGAHDRLHHNDVQDRGTIKAGERFKIVSPQYGEVYAKYPHDPALPIGERANCKCTSRRIFPAAQRKVAEQRLKDQKAVAGNT